MEKLSEQRKLEDTTGLGDCPLVDVVARYTNMYAQLNNNHNTFINSQLSSETMHPLCLAFKLYYSNQTRKSNLCVNNHLYFQTLMTSLHRLPPLKNLSLKTTSLKGQCVEL